VNRLRQW